MDGPTKEQVDAFLRAGHQFVQSLEAFGDQVRAAGEAWVALVDGLSEPEVEVRTPCWRCDAPLPGDLYGCDACRFTPDVEVQSARLARS